MFAKLFNDEKIMCDGMFDGKQMGQFLARLAQQGAGDGQFGENNFATHQMFAQLHISISWINFCVTGILSINVHLLITSYENASYGIGVECT